MFIESINYWRHDILATEIPTKRGCLKRWNFVSYLNFDRHNAHLILVNFCLKDEKQNIAIFSFYFLWNQNKLFMLQWHNIGLKSGELSFKLLRWDTMVWVVWIPNLKFKFLPMTRVFCEVRKTKLQTICNKILITMSFHSCYVLNISK